MRVGAIYAVFNEEDYIEQSLKSIYNYVDRIAICLNTGRPWFGPRIEKDRTQEILENFVDKENKIVLIKGEWENGTIQRSRALDAIRYDVDFSLVIDGDEMFRQKDIENLLGEIESHPYIGQFKIAVYTYWKSPRHRIDPPEPVPALIATKITHWTTFIGERETNEIPVVTIDREKAVLHHFSYAKSPKKIFEKINYSAHAHEMYPDWYQQVWLQWDSNRNLQDLHPVHPHWYRHTIEEEIANLPEVMAKHPYANLDIIEDR